MGCRQAEPLDQAVNKLREQFHSRHIVRLQRSECTVEPGFIHSDLMTDLGRVAGHCSNIAGCVIEMSHSSLELHEYLRDTKAEDPEFNENYRAFREKYRV